MLKSEPATFDLPVATVSTNRPWLAPRTTDELTSAFQATQGEILAIVLDAAGMTRSRPKGICFLIKEDGRPTITLTSGLHPELLTKIAPAAMLLENDNEASGLFDNVDRVSTMGRTGKFQHIAVTPKGVIGWHPSRLVAAKKGDPSVFTKGDLIGGATREDLKSAHQRLKVHAELSDLAATLYTLEVSRLSDYKLRGMHRSARFEVIEAQSPFS